MSKHTTLTPEAIQRFRQDKGLSKHDLASLLGVGVATISRWENGQAHATGTAAVVLQTVIAASHTGLTLDLSLGRGHEIYQLLKDVFDPIDEAQPASII